MWMRRILIPRPTMYCGCDDRSGEQLHTYSSNCAVLAYPRIVGLPVQSDTSGVTARPLSLSYLRSHYGLGLDYGHGHIGWIVYRE